MTDRKKPRFGLVFQLDPQFPGTVAQQDTLRQGIQEFGFGTARWRMLWGFARVYKAKQDELYGGLGTGRHHVNVSVNGAGSYGFANAMVLPSWADGYDLQMFFFHELGHMFDRYLLTPAGRDTLMGCIGIPHRDWTGFASNPHIDYFDRPSERWAWSFQRLCVPDLAEFEYGWHRADMLGVLPNFDEDWVEAGFEIPDS